MLPNLKQCYVVQFIHCFELTLNFKLNKVLPCTELTYLPGKSLALIGKREVVVKTPLHKKGFKIYENVK